MVDRIFEDNDGRYIEPKAHLITYDLKPSPKFHSIRSVIIRRFAEKRKQVSLSDDEPSSRSSKKTKVEELVLCPSGLPSPPSEDYVQPPEIRVCEKPVDSSNTQEQPDVEMEEQKNDEAAAAHGLSVAEITQKLEELKREKHELFQLMKQLMRQEQIDKQQQLEAEKNRRQQQQQEEAEKRRLEAETLKQQQQQQQNASKAALPSPPDEEPQAINSCNNVASATATARRVHGRSPSPSLVPNDSSRYHIGSSSRKVTYKN